MPPKPATPRVTRLRNKVDVANANSDIDITGSSASSATQTPSAISSRAESQVPDMSEDDDFQVSTVSIQRPPSTRTKIKVEVVVPRAPSSSASSTPPSLKRTRSDSLGVTPRKMSALQMDSDSDPAESSNSASAPSSSTSPAATGRGRSKPIARRLPSRASKMSAKEKMKKEASPSPPPSKGRSRKARVVDLKGKGKAIKQESSGDSSSESDLSDASASLGTGDSDSDNDSDASANTSDSDSSAANVPTVALPRRRGVAAGRTAGSWAKKVTAQLLKFHPELESVWNDLGKVTVVEPELADQPEGLKLKLLPFQREGLGWMRKQEKSIFHGGILADEMGMGKTIQMISLLLAEPGKPNLIVAPTVAIIQWKNEIETHAPSLKVLVFHGANRTESIKELKGHDVVLTTYSILESAYRKEKYGTKRKGETVKQDSMMHKIKWHRVVLDEAHNIKERSCNTAKSAFALLSDRKWSLSGTPMQNRVGELYSLIRFMQADPYGYYFCKLCKCKSLHWKYSNMKDCDDCGHRPMDHVCWWNHEVLKPIQNYGPNGPGRAAFGKLRKLLERMMLRRTKIERQDDLGLPPRKTTVSRYLFNEEEEDLYESLFSDTKRKFSTYVEQGTVLNNYANIFELLTKMRQMVDHPDLVLKKIKPGEVGKPETLVCAICQEEAEDPIVSKCHHLFCREDANQYLNSSFEQTVPECPVCHIPLTIDLVQATYEAPDPEDAEVRHKTFARASIVNRINMDTWRSSTKIEALVEHLFNLQREDRSIKSICFSQFVTFLDLVKWRLEKAGFKCVKLDGHMTPLQRDASIRKFTEDPTITVFLISLKAGGVALNLTAASRVFICDPWWNPAAELQAMDRIHRIGQHRPILITRLIIENSIESRILQLQEKKQAMVDSTIGNDPAALAKLSPDDLRFLFVN